MLSKGIINLLNKILNTNLEAKTKLALLANKIVNLNFPLYNLNLLITKNGLLEPTTANPNCEITFPITLISHLIHKELLRTFKQIKITGDIGLAEKFLQIIAGLNYTNILYQNDSQLLKLFAIKIEEFIKNLLAYARLVTQNFGISISQYIQYENNTIVDKYQIERFCNQVDTLKDRYQLLLKRIEKLDCI